MIARILAAIAAARIRHYSRRAAAAGAATLNAQLRRDWTGASRHMSSMHAAQARRDALLQRRGGCPPCNHACREGRDCPQRA